MATTRERRLAKADRLDGWSAGNAARGKADLDKGFGMFDGIPLGQPVMPDHHSYSRDMSYRRKAGAAVDRGFEATNKAADQASRAANIRAAADAAIYSDDDDAIPALESRIADLEAQRALIVTFNKAARKAKGDNALIAAALAELPADLQRSYLSALQHAAYSIRNGAFPSYHLSNLSGSISKQRKRLEHLQRAALTPAGAVVRSQGNRYAGPCRHCGSTVDALAGVAEKLAGEGWTVRHDTCTGDDDA